MTEQAMQIIDTTATLVVARPPEKILEEAQVAAAALMRVVAAKPKKVVFGGEQYLEFEDWQTVARFYGITAKIVSTEFVEYGAIVGFSATAVALRGDGFELSSASADCLNDEEKWRAKPKYERELQMLDGTWVAEPIDETKYPKSLWKWNDNPRRPESRRRQIGEEKVPLFQLKSMAQTRASGKVLRQVLAWVVVLAGYRPTPAEELPDHGDGEAARQAPAASTSESSTTASGHAPQAAGTSAGASGAAPAPGAQPTAAAVPGVTKVAKVETKTGSNAKGPWKRYRALFADGREGVTFSDTLGAALEAAAKDGSLVNPEIVKTEKGHDLKTLLPIVAPEPVPVDEPVSGPEKILTIRKLETDHGTRWVIQTDKRQLVTDQEKFSTDVTEARKANLGIVPAFDVVRGPSGAVNKLTSFTVEGAEPATETREPGQEG